MASLEKENAVSCDLAIQHTETGAGTIQVDSKHAPEIAEALSARNVPETALPDGGIRAWIQVVGCFFLVRTCSDPSSSTSFLLVRYSLLTTPQWNSVWGFTFSYGQYQDYYERHYLTTTSSSAISWIGSIQSFLLILSGLWCGPVFDWGYYAYLIVFGAILSTLGIFMLSFSTLYWQIFITQGLCIGFGCGMLFVPSMALLARSFTKNRSIAVGVTTCGAPVGGIVYTVMFEALLPKLGFAWTVRALGFYMLGTYCLAIPLVLVGAENGKSLSSGQRRKLFDKDALKDLPFWSYSMVTFATFMAYLVPYFYMPYYSQTVLGVSSSKATWTLVISQAASIPGRLLAATAANYFGVMVAWTGCAVISGVVCFAWIGVKSYTGFAIFCAFYGAFSGPLVPLPPSIFPVVCPDPKVLGTRLGMAQSISSIANLIGPPIAGAVLKAQNPDGKHFLGVQLFTGLLMALGAIQLLGLWRLLIRKRGVKFWI